MPGFTKLTLASMLSFVFLLVGCSSKPLEYCDVQGEVYVAIVNNAEEWSRYFSESPSPGGEEIFFEANGRHYAVLYLVYQYRPTQPVLFIQTLGSGWPATELGRGGYFYSANGKLSYEDSRYEIERLSDHIFCYRKEGLPS